MVDIKIYLLKEFILKDNTKSVSTLAFLKKILSKVVIFIIRLIFYIWCFIPNNIGLFMLFFTNRKYKFEPKASSNVFINFIKQNILFNTFGVIDVKHAGVNRMISVGLFSFYVNVDDSLPSENSLNYCTGQCMLSLFLGPLHVLFVGLPCMFYMIYCNIRYRKISIQEIFKRYNEFYIEKIARKLGDS
jgi:hypothetical protein